MALMTSLRSTSRLRISRYRGDVVGSLFKLFLICLYSLFVILCLCSPSFFSLYLLFFLFISSSILFVSRFDFLLNRPFLLIIFLLIFSAFLCLFVLQFLRFLFSRFLSALTSPLRLHFFFIFPS